MTDSNPAVVVVGAGPAGCALAAFLAQRKIPALVFDDDKRPGLLVGESLVPAVVPIFRRLGIEDRVAAISIYKPGASFFVTDGPKLHFTFEGVKPILPAYSYNSPRPELDNLLRRRAEELGATFVKARAEVEPCQREGQPSVKLSERSREAAGIRPECEPLLVDATGRARLFARTMQLPAEKGDRNDIAYFAHYENFSHDEVKAGHVLISVLKAGWSWRIPLPGRLSVGIVVNKERAAALGASPEERLENAIKTEPLMQYCGEQARRITPVMTYTNYQLLSHQGFGPGWVLAGDAFGFVDPMLSPGLFMALEAAQLLDKFVFAKGAGILKRPQALNKALAKYAAHFVDWYRSWTEFIEYFYDGRIYQLHIAGEKLSSIYSKWRLVRWLEHHTMFHLACMASGGKTRSPYSRNFLRFMARHMMWDAPPARNFAIR